MNISHEELTAAIAALRSRIVAIDDARELSVKKIRANCDVPDLTQGEFRAMFAKMSTLINELGATSPLVARTIAMETLISLNDARAMLAAINQADPWLENGHTREALAMAAYRGFEMQCEQTMVMSIGDNDNLMLILGFVKS